MKVSFDRGAILAYLHSADHVASRMSQELDQSRSRLNDCRRRYNRLSGELRELMHRAYGRIQECESELNSLQSQYNACMRDAYEDDENGDIARREAARIQGEMGAVQAELNEAQAEYAKYQSKLSELESAWDRYGRRAESAERRAEDTYSSYSTLSASANMDLGTYLGMMDQAQHALRGGPAGSGFSGVAGVAVQAAPPMAAPSGAGTPTRGGGEVSGEPIASGRAGSTRPDLTPVPGAGDVSLPGSGSRSGAAASGRRISAMTIGGTQYPMTKSGAAKAYRKAKALGDPEMIARCDGIFRVETLRQNLELTQGEPGILQSGGFARDLTVQPGYAICRIPGDTRDLGLLLLAEDREKLPMLPGTGMEAVSRGLVDLRQRLGQRYDGGIGAYLDALCAGIGSGEITWY